MGYGKNVKKKENGHVKVQAQKKMMNEQKKAHALKMRKK